MSTKMSKSFGTMHPLKPHLLQQTGGIAAEVKDIRDDVETAFKNSEGRAGFPELDWLDPGTLLAAGQATFVLRGRNLLQGQTFDTLTLGLTTAGVVVTCLKPGDSGFRMKIVQGTGALAVTFTSGLLTVTLDVGGSTATQVVAAINALPACIGVIFAAVLSGGGGTVLVAAETPLAGGNGLYAGNKVMVSGVEVLPKHQAVSWADDIITVTVQDLTALTPARAATDIVGVVVQSDGVTTGQLSAVLS